MQILHVCTFHTCTSMRSDIIAFATEPVFVSLANVLGYYDNLPSPLPLSIKVKHVTIHIHVFEHCVYMCAI